MKITIKDKTVELKQTLRSAIIYENIQGKSPENIETLTDIVVYIYAVIIGSDPSLKLTFDEFLDYVDEHPDIIESFNQWVLEINGLTAQLAKDVDEKEAKGKKNEKKN